MPSDRNQNRTRQVFLAANGPGPWVCAYGACNQLVTALGQKTDDGVIHHCDEDPSNDDPANLCAMHHKCHIKYHRTGRARPDVSERLRSDWASGARHGHTQTVDTKIKISQTLTGHPVADETRAKIAETLRGRPHTDQRRANLRAAWVRRKARVQGDSQ